MHNIYTHITITVTLPSSLQQEKDSHANSQSTTVHQRRLPLPTKLSFEQNITNLIEKNT